MSTTLSLVRAHARALRKLVRASSYALARRRYSRYGHIHDMDIFTIWTYPRYGHIHDMDIFTMWTYSRYRHSHDIDIFTIFTYIHDTPETLMKTPPT